MFFLSPRYPRALCFLAFCREDPCLRPAYMLMPKHGRGCRWPGLHACVHRCVSGDDMMAQGLWVRGAHLSVDAVLGLGKIPFTQNAGLSARAWRQSLALGGSYRGDRPHCPHCPDCPHCPHWSSVQGFASLGAGAHFFALLSVRFPLGTVPLALAPLPPLLPFRTWCPPNCAPPGLLGVRADGVVPSRRMQHSPRPLLGASPETTELLSLGAWPPG